MSAVDHYRLTQDTFRRAAVEKGGYYDSHPGGPLRHSRWQLMVREMVFSLVGQVYTAARIGDARVLSVGCGRGDLEFELDQHVGHARQMVGCDFAIETLQLAASSAPATQGFDFAAADALRLPFADAAFDLTLCVNMLHHIRTDDHARGVDELARVTRRYVVVELKNADQLYYGWLKSFRYSGIPVYATSVDRLSSYFSPHGFRLVAARHVFRFKVASPLSVLLFERSG